MSTRMTPAAGVRYSVARPGAPHQPGFRGRRWLAIAAPFVVAIIAACKGDATGPTVPETPVGEYTMSTVNTQALPASIYADTGYSLEVASGTLSIKSDGKWVARTTSRETVAGHASTYIDSLYGTWVKQQNSTIAVLTNADDQSTANATWDATGISVVQVDGTITFTFVYRRQ